MNNYPNIFHLISDISKKTEITSKYNPDIRQNKDIPDIINLIRINKVNFKSKEFRELCLKYATEEIYKKIVNSI